MSVHYRPIQLKDIRPCVEHLARHPILRARYGNLIEDLPSAIKHSLRDDYVTVNVFEEFQGSTARFLGAGMAVFVSDDFLREAKATPFLWVGPELVKRITRGNSPLLSEAEVRDANSTSDLNLMVWHNSCHPQDLTRIEVGVAIITAFEEAFRGFRLKEVFAQADCLEHLRGSLDAGGFYFDRLKGGYGSHVEVDARNFSEEPRNFGMTRDLASTRVGWRVSSIFAYGMPQFGFSRGEQRLLLAALGAAATDEELSESLKISLFVVKKVWRSIYDRVAARLPELVPANSISDAESQGRGKQKKQRLLSYLREHPEELRPFSRKLLRQGATQRTKSLEAVPPGRLS